MRAIIGVATVETQELWLARARRYSVRDLLAAARVAMQENVAESRGAVLEQTNAVESRRGILEQTNAATPRATIDSQNDPISSSPRAGAATSVGVGDVQAAGGEVAGGEGAADDPGINIMFRAPARAVALWHWALDLVRRAAGHQEPAWRCVEYVAADFLSGAPSEATRPPAPGEVDTASPARDLPAPDQSVGSGEDRQGHREVDDSFADEAGSKSCAVPDALVWNEATVAARDAMRPLGRAADPDVILTRQSPPEALDTATIDPWDLDARLRGLIRLRQSLAWRQGRLLAVVASRHLHEELGAESFSEWCETTLGISRIRRLPQIADAYRRGLISWCQARHLVRIATPETERRWIRFARQVTVRHLEEAIAQSETETAALPPGPDSATTNGVGTEATNGPGSETTTGSVSEATTAADPPRHMCAPTFSFDDRPECGVNDRADHQIRFWLPTDVVVLWREALAVCRQSADRELADWHCLIIMIDALRRTWDSPSDRGWKRRYRIFERDSWQCRVPGCTSRANLNVHHIVFRSRGGGKDDSNLVTLCVGHHQRGIHDGLVRCTGAAPDDLWWALGVRPSGPPLLRCRGDRIIRGGRLIGPPSEPAPTA
jgi:hypothetical protein